MSKRAPKPLHRPQTPHELRGRPAAGRIVQIRFGQGHGLIRLRNEREIYFHRADLLEGTAFNELQVGDAVTFDLFEDAVSGARALRVVRRQRSGDRRQ